MHVIILPSTDLTDADYQSIPARTSTLNGQVPPPRVGHTAVTIDNYIYIFGGRGGPDMKALEENGRVWIFDTTNNTWSHLDPNPYFPIPPARSYHASVASEHPLPTMSPNIAHVLVDKLPNTTEDLPDPPDPYTYGTIFIHAGCTSDGGRTSDVWVFDISSRSWSPFPSAPDPPCGGTSLAIVHNRLYRFGGFDGKQEVGGQIDFLDLSIDTFNDKGGQGEMALSPQGLWQTNTFRPAAAEKNASGPANRSVTGLVPVSTGQGRSYLLILCGEGQPSTDGHHAAGKFFNDVWSFQLKPEGMTAASLKDATRQAVKKDTGEAECAEVRYHDAEGKLVQEGHRRPMGARGWFACDGVGDTGGSGGVVVWGGVGDDNQRLGDGWLISVE